MRISQAFEFRWFEHNQLFKLDSFHPLWLYSGKLGAVLTVGQTIYGWAGGGCVCDKNKKTANQKQKQKHKQKRHGAGEANGTQGNIHKSQTIVSTSSVNTPGSLSIVHQDMDLNVLMQSPGSANEWMNGWLDGHCVFLQYFPRGWATYSRVRL